MVQLNLLIRFEVKGDKLYCYVYRPFISRIGLCGRKLRRLEIRTYTIGDDVDYLKYHAMKVVSEKYGQPVVDITDVR